MPEQRPPRPPHKRQPRSKATAAVAARGSDASPARTASSSATTSDGAPPNLLGLESDTFVPAEQPAPADDGILDDYQPPSREPIEWTPDRAAAIVRGTCFILHTADGLSREPEGRDLWRATDADIDAIAPPLSRIMNRYEPARRLAGVSDEAELAVGIMGYARTQLAERGRVATAKRRRLEEAEEAAAATGGPSMFTPEG